MNDRKTKRTSASASGKPAAPSLDTDPPEVDRPAPLRRAEWLVPVALCLLPLAWQRPYWASRHAEDDLDHLLYLSQYLLGERSLLRYLLCPINEHLLPLWRLWYLGCWRIFGLDSTGWHVCVSLMHGLGAAFLFFVLRRATGQLLPALAGSSLWALAGVAGWDSPLSWLPASHLVFGITWLLGAMACLTQYRATRGWTWPLLMALCVLLAVGNMSAMWILTPALAAQWWLLERRPTDPWLPRGPWLWAWLIPFLVLGVVAVAAARGVFLEVPPQPTGHDALAGVLRTVASWELTAENLVARRAEGDPQPRLPFRVAGGVVLVAGALFLAGPNRRFVLLVLGVVFVYTVLVQTARSVMPAEYSLGAGRYAYLPVWGWCCVLAALVAHPWLRGTGRFARIVATLLVAAAPWLAFQQFRVTEQVARETRYVIALSANAFHQSVQLAGALAGMGRERGQPVRVADFTWLQRPSRYTLRRLLAVAYPQGQAGITIVSGREWTAADLADAQQLLARRNNPMRWTWDGSLEAHRQVAAALSASENAAHRAGQTYTLVNSEVTIELLVFVGRGAVHPPRQHDPEWRKANFQLLLSDYAKVLFPDGLRNVRLVEAGTLTPQQRAATLAQYATIEDPLMQQFAEQLKSLPQSPPAAK
ncbi:MAG: hypothetical protein K1X74_19235 [Pirellulales bacterium]|nr:hypothetical protein [Pirellulales bacterium]